MENLSTFDKIKKAFEIFLSTFNSYLSSDEKEFVSLLETKELEDIVSFASNLNNFRNHGELYIKTVHLKKYPNINIDVRLKMATDSIVKINIVYPSMEKELVNVNQVSVDIESARPIFDWEDVYSSLKKQFLELVNGARPFNVIDLGTYNLITVGKYEPHRTDRKIEIVEFIISEILSYRKTDLFYSFDNIFYYLLNETDKEKRKIFIEKVKEIIERMVSFYLSRVIDDVYSLLDVKGRAVNLSIPPFLKSDLKRFENILVNLDVQNSSHSYVVKMIDKFMSHLIMSTTVSQLKKFFNVARALYITSIDIPYSNILSPESEENIKKCYNIAMLESPNNSNSLNSNEKSNYRCFKRQMLDIINLIQNDKVVEIIKNEFEELDTELPSKYAFKYIAYYDRLIDIEELIHIYFMLKNKTRKTFLEV